jgi:hypothetical protein
VIIIKLSHTKNKQFGEPSDIKNFPKYGVLLQEKQIGVNVDIIPLNTVTAKVPYIRIKRTQSLFFLKRTMFYYFGFFKISKRCYLSITV